MFLLHDSLEDKIKHRKTLKKCDRCGLLYKKSLVACSYCDGIDDERLAILLQKKVKDRVGLGKVMIAGALGLLFVMVVILSD